MFTASFNLSLQTCRTYKMNVVNDRSHYFPFPQNKRELNPSFSLSVLTAIFQVDMG